MASIPAVERNDLDPAGQVVWDHIAGDRGDVPTSYRSMMHSPGAAGAVAGLGRFLRFESGLDPVVRELAVLVVNRDTRCDFGWEHHELLAREMGVPDDAISELKAGRTPAGLSETELLAVTLAEQCGRDGRADAPTVARSVDLLGRQQTVDLILAVGYYTMVAQYCLSMDLSVLPGSLDHLGAGTDVALARGRTGAGPPGQR